MQNGKNPKEAAPATAPQVTGRVVTADISLYGFRVGSPPVYGGSVSALRLFTAVTGRSPADYPSGNFIFFMLSPATT